MLKLIKQNKYKTGALVAAAGAAVVAGAGALGVEVPSWIHALIFVFGQ